MAVMVPIRKLDDSCVLTVDVRVTREFRLRMWVALKLIRLGWWIAGGRVEVKVMDEDQPPPTLTDVASEPPPPPFPPQRDVPLRMGV